MARREGLLRGSLYYWSFLLTGRPRHRFEYYLRLWRLDS